MTMTTTTLTGRTDLLVAQTSTVWFGLRLVPDVLFIPHGQIADAFGYGLGEPISSSAGWAPPMETNATEAHTSCARGGALFVAATANYFVCVGFAARVLRPRVISPTGPVYPTWLRARSAAVRAHLAQVTTVSLQYYAGKLDYDLGTVGDLPYLGGHPAPPREPVKPDEFVPLRSQIVFGLPSDPETPTVRLKVTEQAVFPVATRAMLEGVTRMFVPVRIWAFGHPIYLPEGPCR